MNLEARLLKVPGKGAKERLVPIGFRVERALWKYRGFYRPEPALPRYDNFFLTEDGRRLTKDRLLGIVKGYGRRAGISSVRLSPHTFRHTFAVMYLRKAGIEPAQAPLLFILARRILVLGIGPSLLDAWVKMCARTHAGELPQSALMGAAAKLARYFARLPLSGEALASLPHQPEVWQRLRDEAERAKIRLCYSPVVWVACRLSGNGVEALKHLETELAREQFDALTTDLVERLDAGAQPRGTEDPAPLLEEHRPVRGLMHNSRDSLTESRDRFIAQAVSSTLKEAEIGMLFIGTYHSVEPHLTPDIRV